MKKKWFVICLLVVSMFVLADAGLNTWEVSAGIYCSQLKSCDGSSGCTVSGSVTGCTITCSDNTTVTCNATSGSDGFLE